MKLIICYDGSRCSEAALDDLVRAGLPETSEVLVVSVAEVWLPPHATTNGTRTTSSNPSGIHVGPHYEKIIQDKYEKDERVVAEAQAFADHAKKRLQQMFPQWRVKAEATYGSPAWEVLTKADVFGPDLIVVGSHGRSAWGRLFLGSISQKVVTEAGCSVRVARGRIEVDPVPTRIAIGFDGSPGSQAAVDAVAKRCWHKFSEVLLIAALENATPRAIDRFISPIEYQVKEIDHNGPERKWVEQLADGALAKLGSRGISSSLRMVSGKAKDLIVSEAERWNADCIFVGANGHGLKLERFLVGSTSAAVTARAHCSVELVRQ